MSIYNRRMFNRNARNALNASAGIQSFSNGGGIKFVSGPQPKPNPFGFKAPGIASMAKLYAQDPSQLTATQRADLLARQRQFQVYNAMRPIPGDTRLGNIISEGVRQTSAGAAGIGDLIARPVGNAMASGLQYLLSSPDGSGPLAQPQQVNLERLPGETSEEYAKRVEKVTNTPVSTTMGQRVASVQKPDFVPLSDDFLRSLNVVADVDPTNLQTASARGPALRRGVVGGPTELTQDIDPALRQARDELDKKKAAEAAALSPTGSVTVDEITGEITPDMTPAPAEVPEQPDDTNQARKFPSTATDTGEGTGTGTGTGTGEAGDDTNQNRQFPETKEEIDRVINEGTPEEQEKTLDSFIKEFMDKAPGYEGADSGLVLAKIGFAMAAGKSPSAIENIASAMSDGADMLIKDKAKKDEFNRQLKLSALQYGLQETGKIRAEERLADREGRKLNYFVAEEEVTVGDRTYGKGETVPVSTEFILNNGLPSGLQTPEMAKAALTANAAYQKALASAAKDKIIDTKTYTGLVKDINEATTDFVSANQLRELVQGNIVRNAEGKITGVGPAFQQLINNAFNAAGVDAGQKYESVQKFNQDMRRVSNLLLKDLLGEGSKNVSNIDRTLADEIVGLYAGYGGYIFQDENLLNERLQNVLTTLEGKERNALNIFRGVLDSTEGLTFASGKSVAFNIPQAAQQQISGTQAAQPTYELQDGVYRRIGVKQSDRIAG